MEFDTPGMLELIERLEHSYSLRPRHPERESVYAGYRERSERLRATWPHWKPHSYGTHERHGIDWYGADPSLVPAGGAPLLVFIHGGFWRALDRHIFGFIAEHYVAAGVHVAMIGYELAPSVHIGQIVGQAKAAMRWLNGHASALNIDVHRVSVSGHSAGGHLAALIAATPPQELGGQRLVAAIPVSGVFDLAPLMLTSINHDVRMTVHDARRYSLMAEPAFHVERMIVAVGGRETEGFVGQSRDFAAAAARLGVQASLEIVPDRTHFDVLEDLSGPEYPLFQQVRAAVTAPRALSTGMVG